MAVNSGDSGGDTSHPLPSSVCLVHERERVIPSDARGSPAAKEESCSGESSGTIITVLE